MTEFNICCLAAVFTADTHLQVLLDLTSLFHSYTHKSSYTFGINRNKRVLLQYSILDIEWQESSRIITGKTVDRLGKVIGPKRIKVSMRCYFIRSYTSSR